MPSNVVHSTYCAFFPMKSTKGSGPFLILYLKYSLVGISAFTEYLIQTLLSSLHLEFRFHFSDVILGLKLFKIPHVQDVVLCIFITVHLLLIDHCYFTFCAVHLSALFYFCVLVWSHLRMLSRVTYWIIFYLMEVIIIQMCSVASLSKSRALIVNVCVRVVCMFRRGVYIFEGVSVFLCRFAVAHFDVTTARMYVTVMEHPSNTTNVIFLFFFSPKGFCKTFIFP